jgi:hypothetical protein
MATMVAERAKERLTAHIQEHGPVPTVRVMRWGIYTPSGLRAFWYVMRGQIAIHNGMLWHVGLEDGLPYDAFQAAVENVARLAQKEKRIEFDWPFGPVCERDCVDVLARLEKKKAAPARAEV